MRGKKIKQWSENVEECKILWSQFKIVEGEIEYYKCRL